MSERVSAYFRSPLLPAARAMYEQLRSGRPAMAPWERLTEAQHREWVGIAEAGRPGILAAPSVAAVPVRLSVPQVLEAESFPGRAVELVAEVRVLHEPLSSYVPGGCPCCGDTTCPKILGLSAFDRPEQAVQPGPYSEMR